MTAARRSPLLVRAGSAAALVLVLAGCTPGGQFDPTTLFANDTFDTKTKLKGDRQPVFPNGVPAAARSGRRRQCARRGRGRSRKKQSEAETQAESGARAGAAARAATTAHQYRSEPKSGRAGRAARSGATAVAAIGFSAAAADRSRAAGGSDRRIAMA